MNIVFFVAAVIGGVQSLTLFEYFIGSYNLLGIFNEPYPAKPDPRFPSVKLIIATSGMIIFDKIDPENLNEYTSKLNSHQTVFYVYGFLDKTASQSDDSGNIIEATSSFMLAYALLFRNFIALIAAERNVEYPESLFTNIIVLDWSAYNTDYISSLTNMPQIANVIGDQLYAMSQDPNNKLNLESWQFVGFSLGAHLAGMIARRMKERAGRIVIPRMTGLDPAGPVIEFAFIRDLYPRLTKDCALFVDIIHTNAGVYGSDHSLGHVDFWPNGGSNQPGCVKTSFLSFILQPGAICSHLRAVELYVESIQLDLIQISVDYPDIGTYETFYPPFEAVRCTRFAEFNFLIDKVKYGKLQCTKNENVKVLMGLSANPAISSGNYYLMTNTAYFYTLGVNGTQPYLDGNAPGEGISFQ